MMKVGKLDILVPQRSSPFWVLFEVHFSVMSARPKNVGYMFVELLEMPLISGSKEMKVQLLLQKKGRLLVNIINKTEALNNNPFMSLNLMWC